MKRAKKTILLSGSATVIGIVMLIIGFVLLNSDKTRNIDASIVWILAFMALMIVFGFGGLIKYRTSDKNISLHLKKQEEDTKVRDLLLENAKARLWQIKDGKITIAPGLTHDRRIKRSRLTLEEFRAIVHPDSMKSYDELCNINAEVGYKSKRLQLSYDGETWKWYEFVYGVTKETARKGTLAGLMLNIMTVVENEMKMIDTQHRESEIKAKESFIVNIGTKMNIPFEAIIGTSQLFAHDKGDLTTEDKQELSNIIHENTEDLLGIINKVAYESLAEKTEENA
ncbi:MAG: hypothetical protein MJZ12_04650 [Prevotella sp.]|nr:hypothetical protein [Prevotella sp.]